MLESISVAAIGDAVTTTCCRFTVFFFFPLLLSWLADVSALFADVLAPLEDVFCGAPVSAARAVVWNEAMQITAMAVGKAFLRKVDNECMFFFPMVAAQGAVRGVGMISVATSCIPDRLAQGDPALAPACFGSGCIFAFLQSIAICSAA
jgi:hypothetical protein